MNNALVGVMGGSGLYEMEALEDVQEWQVETPFGPPSDAIMTGRVDGVAVAFLARHGRGHRLIPSEIPYRANVFALKTLGVRYLISLSAVGSLRQDLRPLDMVLPDQFIDLTRRRESTFFGTGAVAHVSMAQPVCAQLADVLARAVVVAGLPQEQRLHRGGTYVCIEGPQFSTMAESHWYRSMGASVIGMTNMPEAKLAREAQMAYASLAMVTDYDCWNPREPHVTSDFAIANLMKNAGHAQHIARAAVLLLGAERPASDAHAALATALVSRREHLQGAVRERVETLLA
ncbi:MAG: S-methyl-5'-thioadenosine phosphorylase [Simplicispira suum]|uniref:S-methyl-5'-thioadenosine phosphorylase n=1 Tax=Simplicispira suum TaxID=2109915 RepID=UPI001C6AC286|nr:S-methyl-5'-thioadenosine phosphorylase [Simplicispira suum]MBW7832988.1 S-methyl-5'-thioadenosine phosphorylase [Simplicispira suum]